MTISSDIAFSSVDRNSVLIVVLGPTGVGKTEVSLSLAKHYQAPIVSSDSRQIYRELPIGTAAPTAQEMAVTPHFFIGTHSVTENYSAGQYETEALQLLETELFPQHPVVLMSGGSMMYIDAVCKGLDDIPTINQEVREYWSSQFMKHGLDFLQQELYRLDPVHFASVDLKNHKRVLHALEICMQTGQPYSVLRTGQLKERPFTLVKIGLNRPRPELYERINTRVDHMMEQGLLDEAKAVYHHRHLNSLNTVGYKELFEYLDGTWPLDFAVQMIQQNSRRYAKRQLTWFNRDQDIHWFHPDDLDGVHRFLNNALML